MKVSEEYNREPRREFDSVKDTPIYHIHLIVSYMPTFSADSSDSQPSYHIALTLPNTPVTFLKQHFSFFH